MKRILFYVSEVAHFWDSMRPLFYKYVECGAKCTIIFPVIEKIYQVGRGIKNADRIQEIMDEIKKAGAKTYYLNEWDSSQSEFDICFTYSDYIKVDSEIRKRCRYIVAVQTTAIYTHVYVGVSGFEQLFGVQSSKNIDYIVVSDFAADWIRQRTKSVDKKLLRFGYPRLDELFIKLNNSTEIPEKWMKKINGKKVFLVVGANDKPYWISNIKKGIIIYRPHPFQIEREEEEGVLEELRGLENVIIDDTKTYYNAFKISDAIISTVLCSLSINYLLTDKPVLLLDGLKFDSRISYVANYKEEAWYKASYIAKEEKDIIRFIEMIDEGNDFLREEHLQYYQYMNKNFDGRVCERIVDYFDNRGIENEYEYRKNFI